MKFYLNTFSKKKLRLILLLLITILNNQMILSIKVSGNAPTPASFSGSPWCWTSPQNNNPEFQVTPIGGLNWGFLPQGNSQAAMINYAVELHTSKREKSGTTSKIFIKIYGTQGASENKLFSNGVLEVGSMTTKTFPNKDLGQLYKVKLFIVGQQCYRPYKVKIFSGNGTEYSFESLKKICPCKPGGDPTICTVELFEEGNVSYKVEIKTKDEEKAGRQGPIDLLLMGTNGISREKIWNELGAERGSSVSKDIKTGDLGDIVGYRLIIPTRGMWEPSLVIITNNITNDRKTFALEKAIMFNPGKPSFDYNFVAPKPNTSNAPGLGDENIFGDDAGPYQANYHATLPPGGGNYGDRLGDQYNKFVNLNQNSGIGPEGRTQVGALMTSNEKKRMLKLSCTQKLINPSEEEQLFGPDFADGQANFYSILGKCPNNCDKNTDPVYGVSIHPDKTPICLAALIDKAMPPSGGIIAINVYPALTKYALPPGFTKIGNITLKSFYEQAGKSFTLAKVDNIDMIEKDIRIVDNTGKLASEGRVEFRMEGYWGTLCFQGVNDQAAIRICKDLEYNFGTWKNPTDGANNEYCRNHKGEDFCGSMYQMSFYKELVCDPKDKTVNGCNKKMANPRDCNHTFDAILSCSNDDIQADTANNSSDSVNGTIKLVSHRNIYGEEIGRMEVFQKQKWGTVCDVGFSNDSGEVACRQMGYDSGRWYNSEDAKEWKKPTDDNYPMTAAKVECSGQENNIAECEYLKNNIACKHDHDVVLACRGKKGDPTGVSQTKPKAVTPTPDLGRLGMSYLRLSCQTTGKDRMFRGDPGSVFIIECPPGCDKTAGSVYGVGLYSSDSNVCKSACHAGVLPCDNGGEAILVKAFGQKNYDATVSHSIESTRRLLESDVSFTFTKKWSNYDMYKNMLLNNNLANVNHKNVLQQNFFERILNGASNRLNSILTGSQEERESYHANQAVSNNAAFFVNAASMDNKVSDPWSVDVGGANITGGLSIISFLELGQSVGSQFGPVAFKWIESVGTHKFNEYGKIIQRGGPLKSLETMYTMFFVFTMEEWRREEAYLFSYSGCGGFNIWLDLTSSLNLGDPCDETKRINTGLNIPLKDKCVLYIQYNKKKLIISLKLMKVPGVFNRQREFTLTIPEQDKLCLGCRASDEMKVFVGSIDFIIFFEALVPKEFVRLVINEIDNQKKSSDNVNNNPVTSDGRKCVSQPMSGPTPGMPGAPTPPPKANPYVGKDSPINPPSGDSEPSPMVPDVYEDHPLPDSLKNPPSFLEKKSSGFFKDAFNKVKNFLFGKKKKANNDAPKPPPNPADESSPVESTLNKDDESNLASVKIDCENNAMDKRFNNQNGKLFRVSCGSCSNARYPVFGSKIYHPRSSICRAAIHAGVLPVGKKGEIILQIGQGYPAFNGEPGGGAIMSRSMGSEIFSFIVTPAPPLRKVQCYTRGNEDEFGTAKRDTKFLVVCPKYCAKKKGAPKIFGSGVYADLSPICLAAFHDGIIGDQGGNVQLMFTDGLSEYKGTQGFSVKSDAAGPQLRSFTFLGNKSSVFHSYTETCQGRIIENWKQLDDRNTIYQNENAWSFYNNNKWLNRDRIKEPLQTIQHWGRIKNKSLGIVYATVLKYSNLDAEWANGLIKVNVMLFGKEGRAGIMFRYQDNDNHYGIVFDMTDKNNNFKLYRKIEGSIEIIGGYYMDIAIGIWYRVQIFLDYNNVRVTLQTGNVRQHKEIFNKPIKGIQRGTLAFGVDYMRRVFFMGVKIKQWTPDSFRNPLEKNYRCIIESVQHNLTMEKRIAACRRLYKTKVDEMNRCLEPHIYCKLKCDENISIKEPIANFCCFRTCVQQILDLNKPPVLGDNSWTPSINEKVDYLQKGETIYIMAQVKTVKDDPFGGEGAKIVTLKFVSPDGNESSSEEKWTPTARNLVKCGQELSSRRDCATSRII